MKSTFWLESSDHVKIYVEKWHHPDKQPKAILQIAHGMVEHFQRYHHFNQFLLEKGIFVYGNDHRGHGKTGVNQERMGYFSAENGFDKVTEDMYALTKQIKKEFPNTPVFLFGHSMGSFLSRYYIQKYSNEIYGVIFSGTGYYPKLTTTMGKLLSSRLNPLEKSPLMNRLAFGTFNRHITNPKSPFDWLTRDEKIVKAYMQDQFCGFIPTARFFYDLMTGLQYIHDSKRNSTIRKDLPLLFLSGEDDPVGNFGKGIWKTANLYQNQGLELITTVLFEGARHEVLNELNRHEVYDIIINWVLRQI